MHRALGVPLYAQAALPGVHTGLFQRGNVLWLFATNMNATEVQTRVTLHGLSLTGPLMLSDRWTGGEWTSDPQALHIQLPARSGGAWRLQQRPKSATAGDP